MIEAVIKENSNNKNILCMMKKLDYQNDLQIFVYIVK